MRKRSSELVDDLKKVVADPSYMDQKEYPICGADTYLRMYAVHHPEAYIGLVTSLFQTGTGTLGKQTITIPSSVRDNQLSTAKMHITEWIATASLRIQSNKFYGSIIRSGGSWNFPKSWHAGLRASPRSARFGNGSTMPGSPKPA
jgi:hypothetical protein